METIQQQNQNIESGTHHLLTWSTPALQRLNGAANTNKNPAATEHSLIYPATPTRNTYNGNLGAS